MSLFKTNWKQIPEFPAYEIHINGLVRHIETGTTMRAFVHHEAPHLRVRLRKTRNDITLHDLAVLPTVRELFTQEEVNNVTQNR